MRDAVEVANENDSVSAIKASIATMFSKRSITVENKGFQRVVPVPMGHQKFPLFYSVAVAEGGCELLMRLIFNDLDRSKMEFDGVCSLVSLSSPSQKRWKEVMVSDSSARAMIWEFSQIVTILTAAEAARQIYRNVEMRLPDVDAVFSLHREVCA
tara:strand:- start:2497 stop:2961 length:465 start_codon:yes stop_codon:yes gene_type:complete